MSTSVFVKGISGPLPVPAGGSGLAAAAAQLLAPVLHRRGGDEHGDDRPRREAHRDRVADLLVPLEAERVRDARPERVLQERLDVRWPGPADLLLRVVHPEGGHHDRRDEQEEQQRHREDDRTGPGPLEVPDERLGTALEALRALPDRRPGRDIDLTHALRAFRLSDPWLFVAGEAAAS